MSRKAAAALAVLLVLGTASAVRADADDRIAASRLAVERSAPLCRDGIAGRSRIWIKLTEPGGKLIHINVEHVTSVRSDTQIPGARAQLDLTSGKFQGVQETIDEIMALISPAPGAREWRGRRSPVIELRAPGRHQLRLRTRSRHSCHPKLAIAA